jgi:hypothetical protein
MSLSCFLHLANGTVLHRCGANPFRPDPVPRPSILLPTRPVCAAPVRPVLPAAADAESQSRGCSRAEKLEAFVLKSLRPVLVLLVIGCGFGVQHIAHTRQINRLSRQLQQRELELRAVTQTCRTLESAEALRGAAEFRPIDLRPVAVKGASRIAAPGG